ncbi:unnamed protein product [Musa banksii]
MNRSPYVSLLSKAVAFVPCCRPADAALFLATHSYSATSGAPQSSLMAEYLVSSCGFDPDQAAKASKLLGRVESRHQPDSVLGLFKSYGFDNTQVKKVISANPRWLLLDVEKTLAPKFRALQDLGFSCSDITHLVRSNNDVTSDKSENILSKIQLWQDLLESNDFLVNLCKKNRRFLGYSIEKTIQPNIEILRDCGITDQKLSMIIRHRPLLITRNAETLKALISRVEGLGVPRTSGIFPLTLCVLQRITEKNFKAHLEFFKGFGWSEDDFLAAFRKVPTLVGLSLKSLQRKMEFLVNEAGCAPSHLALRPDILLCKKKFVEKFVNCYKEYPELIELYNGTGQLHVVRPERPSSTWLHKVLPIKTARDWFAMFLEISLLVCVTFQRLASAVCKRLTFIIIIIFLNDVSRYIYISYNACQYIKSNIINSKSKVIIRMHLPKLDMYIITTPPSLGFGEEKEPTKKKKK